MTLTPRALEALQKGVADFKAAGREGFRQGYFIADGGMCALGRIAKAAGSDVRPKELHHPTTDTKATVHQITCAFAVWWDCGQTPSAAHIQWWNDVRGFEETCAILDAFLLAMTTATEVDSREPVCSGS